MADPDRGNFIVNNPVMALVRLVAPLAYAGVILWLSLSPSPPQITGVMGWDKLQHAAAYALLAALVGQCLIYLFPKNMQIWFVAGVVSLFYGGLLELLQGVSDAGRSAEWWDLFADLVGISLSCAGLKIWAVLPRSRVKGTGNK